MYFGRGVLIFQRNWLPSSSGHPEYAFTTICDVTFQETKLCLVTNVKLKIKAEFTL
jgi:hypothetical protein